MTPRDIIIRIKALFEGEGAKQATDQVAELGQRSTQASGQVAAASQNFSSLGSAARSAGGDLSSMSASLGSMAKQIPALAGAAGPIAIAIAAFVAWKKVIDAVKDAQESLAAGLRDTALTNAQARIATLTREYDALQKSIANAAAEANAYYSAETARDNAQLQASLASLDLQSAQRKAALRPGDTLGSRAIDLDIAQQRAALTDAAAATAAERELDSLRAQVAATDTTIRGADEQLAALAATAADLGAQFSHISERTRERSSGRFLTSTARNARIEKGEAEMAKITAALGAITSQMSAITQQRTAAEREQRILGSRADPLLIAQDTQKTRAETGAVTRATDAATLERDRLAAQEHDRLAALRARARTAAQTSSAREAAFRAEADAFDPQRRDYPRQTDYLAARSKDRRLDTAADKATATNSQIQALLAEIEKTPIEKIATSISRFSARLSTLERALADSERRSRQP